ncbi:MAG: hypothetical protein R2709_00730 [Marmoricola sp.]
MADDPMVLFNVTDQVREAIQQNLYTLLRMRRPAAWLSGSGGAGRRSAGVAGLMGKVSELNQ